MDLSGVRGDRGAGRGLKLRGHPRCRLRLPSAPGEATVTSQGNPRVVFRRALERGNLVVAEITARELGGLNLKDALELTSSC